MGKGRLPEVLSGEQFAAVQRLLWQEIGFLEDQRKHKNPVANYCLRQVREYANEFKRTRKSKYALAALQVRGRRH